ncbi:MAG: malonyl-[acyl-carrier protein] O-methyltransferase BioC [Rhodocyclaceae bacterium]|nr:MAG: malonyl-[acyl-carrier protein] O-methyltransferase BioC [Rhodocyclaceae bacterium]
MAQAEIRRAFSRAAPRYDAVADYQREVGKRLLAGLPWSELSGRVLDLGCGTGHGSALLSHAFAGLEVTALDFALPMVQRLFSAPPALPLKVCADAQQLPLRDGCFDFCWSSLALQWCDPAQVFGEIARVLKPGGRLALTTLGPATFAELRQAFAAVDSYRHTIDFCDEGPLREALLQAGLKTVRWERRSIALYRPDVRSLLAGVRELGANRIANVQPEQRRSGLMGKAAWQRLQQAFETLRTARGLPLTYDTFFIYAEK